MGKVLPTKNYQESIIRMSQRLNRLGHRFSLGIVKQFGGKFLLKQRKKDVK